MSAPITPKTFAPHLLAVLGELTSHDPERSAPMEETYGAVCERLGVQEEALGQSPHGALVTHRKIGLAMRQMRDRGLTRYAKRGHWMLTPDGARKTRAEAGFPSDAQEAARVEAALVGDADETNENVVEMASVQPTHPYSGDPYIRGIAIQQTPCFGAHLEGNSVCLSCPLATECGAGIGARKAAVAAGLDAEERARITRAEATKARREQRDDSVDELMDAFDDREPAVTGAAVSGNSPGSKGKFRMTLGQKVTNAFPQRETFCNQCGEKIPQDQKCRWVQDEGVFHEECLDETSAPS